MNAREIALDMIIHILEEKKPSHVVINEGLKRESNLQKQDRAFISRIVIGCVSKQITLDYDINRFSKVNVNKMKPLIRNLLRMGVYQIRFMDQTQDFAVCNEAVKLVKKRGFVGLSGFVNGILRNVVRQKDALMVPPKGLSDVEIISYEYSMPLWLCEFFQRLYGIDKTKEIFEAFEKEKETSIRCELQKNTVEELTKALESEHIHVEPGSLLSQALRISGYDSLSQIKAFQKGLFTVQDESSMLVGEISGVEKDAYVIDVCAAPGGKALHIASKLNGTGHVIACDKTEYKVELIRQNVKRLHADCVEAVVSDALVKREDFVEKADLVIADLPCSGLGVIGRKPDIKYNMNQHTMKELSKLQREILLVVTQYVKQGKTLLYSTCTINPMENEENVTFIKDLGFELEDLTPYLPEKLRSEKSKQGYLQILPCDYNSDGFFIARFRKR